MMMFSISPSSAGLISFFSVTAWKGLSYAVLGETGQGMSPWVQTLVQGGALAIVAFIVVMFMRFTLPSALRSFETVLERQRNDHLNWMKDREASEHKIRLQQQQSFSDALATQTRVFAERAESDARHQERLMARVEATAKENNDAIVCALTSFQSSMESLTGEVRRNTETLEKVLEKST